MTISAFIAGRVIWCGDLGSTKHGNPMRSALVAVDPDSDDKDGGCPPIMARIFDVEAEHVTKGDFLAAEGPLEAGLYEKDGKQGPSLKIMARWCRLTGHAAQRVRKSIAGTKAAARRDRPDRNEPKEEFRDDELPFE